MGHSAPGLKGTSKGVPAARCGQLIHPPLLACFTSWSPQLRFYFTRSSPQTTVSHILVEVIQVKTRLVEQLPVGCTEAVSIHMVGIQGTQG